MSGRVGFFYRPDALTIDEARHWIYSYLLTLPDQLPPVVISATSKTPNELIKWLGVPWREAAPLQADIPEFAPELIEFDEGSAVYRLRVAKLEPFTYLAPDRERATLHAKDPVVWLADKSPSEALTLAIQALHHQIDELSTRDLSDDAVTLTAALRQLQSAPPLCLHLLAPLEPDEPLPPIEALRQQGFLPQAVFNLLCLLCWPVPEGAWSLSNQLLWPLSALPGQTSLRFDLQRLRTFNEVYLRSLSFEELGEQLAPFLHEKGLWKDEHSILQWAKLARDEISTLADVEQLRYLVDCTLVGPDNVDAEALRVMQEETSLQVLSVARDHFAKGDTDFHALRASIERSTGAKRKKLFYPLRIALTGKIYGPSFPEILPFLGAKKCLARVEYWLSLLQQKRGAV